MSIRFADISEFQDFFNADGYLRDGNEVIIYRTHNGYRADKKMPERMALIRETKFTLVGYYIYLVRDRDPGEQAREFCSSIGRLKDNEFAIVDHEEGTGDQQSRCRAALAVVDQWAGFNATLYSGAAYLQDNLGGAESWDRPLWIASYTNSGNPDGALYPRGATFWQYTDHARFAGLPPAVDGSWYAQSALDLFADVRPVKPSPGPQKAAQTLSVVPQADHDQEVFTLAGDGTVWHRWQKDGRWQDWSSLGAP